MGWHWTALSTAAARTQAASAGLAASVVTDDWVQLQDAKGAAIGFGPFHRGRFLMYEELVAAAAIRLYPARAGGAQTAPAELLQPPADVWQEAATQAGDAALLFVTGAELDHRAMVAAGFARWFSHSGQAILRRDRLSPALEQHLRTTPPLAELTAPPTAEALDGFYTNYCALTGQWPRYRRPAGWWQALLGRTDLTVRTIALPTYDEEDPEELTGPRDPSGYVVYRDAGGVREVLEIVVSIIDGDEDVNIDLLLNDSLHAIVREAFGLGAAGAAGASREVVWHGSPGDLLWSRTSMYGAEMREQTSSHYLRVLKPDVVAQQLVKPAVEQEVEAEFEGEITVDLSDLDKIAFRRKGDRKAGRLTVRMPTAEFVACMLHPYRLTGLVQEGGIEFKCDDPEIDPMWVVFSSLFDVLHPFCPVLE